MRVCNVPGCPRLTKQSKCEQHRKQARRDSDSKRPTAAQRGYDAQWRRTRADYLRSHPICEDPKAASSPPQT